MKNPASGHVGPLERNTVKLLYEQQLPAHKSTLQQLAQEMRIFLEQQGLAPAIKYRVKSFEAYFDKLRKRNGHEGNARNVTVNDFFGLRIVCPFLEDIETVSSLIATRFEVLETERKANQHSFREFGYDSLHLAIRFETQQAGRLIPGIRKVCEIQLRTILQEAWAEVEHELVYKSDISLPNQSVRRKLASLNATLTLSDLIFQEIRDYQKEIRRHGSKRRAIVEREHQDQGFIAISHPTTTNPPARMGPIPSSVGSHLEKTMLRALEAHSNHELENAIDLYDQLLSMQLDRKVRGLVYNHRGMAYFAMGHHQRALKDFSNAVTYDAESDRGYANRGLCYRVLKRSEKALQDFNQALKINPNRPESYFGRAQTYYDMQQFDLALADCEKALGVHSGYQPARELIKILQSDFP
ncbi:MAG: tetratricopeptide repeat protein [Desulfuromonadales bacterium]|nr:tetratricopeptide repeat protein [Desulfuromonadales bacterium]